MKSEQAKKECRKLASQAQDLRDLLGKLEQERQAKRRREEEARRLAQQQAEEQRRLDAEKMEQKQTADLIKSPEQSITTTSTGFAKAKGTLPMPARQDYYGVWRSGG